MGYNREVYDAAMAELERRRSEARSKAAALHDRMALKYPRIPDIEQQMSQSAIQVARAVLAGGDVIAAVSAIRSQNLALQAELAELLSKEGERALNFEPRYACPHCEDTGYKNGRMCDCLSLLLREEAFKRLSYTGMMKDAAFDTFQLDYYPDTAEPRGVSPSQRMKEVLAYCRCYADDFGDTSPSLLLRGPTGIGKTHMSLAIAKQVITKGCGVVYGPVQRLLHQLEKEHFGRAGGNSEEMMLECDLLILDDLGAEFASPFYTSCLYNLINSRMLDGKPTIISTNLTQSELMERYGEQITSRLIGTFVPLTFAGKDIRQIRLRDRIQTSCRIPDAAE